MNGRQRLAWSGTDPLPPGRVWQDVKAGSSRGPQMGTDWGFVEFWLMFHDGRERSMFKGRGPRRRKGRQCPRWRSLDRGAVHLSRVHLSKAHVSCQRQGGQELPAPAGDKTKAAGYSMLSAGLQSF